jgi:CheY-like chemotaxis protein
MTTTLQPTAPEVAAAVRILIVDDSRAIQAIVRRVVERIGYPSLQLQVASNGEQALRLVDSFKPQLVLSDWHMPEMSGLEMFQMLRQYGHKQLMVGFITTETSADLLDEARRNGAVFILNKPFRDDDLVHAVTQALPVPAAGAQVPAEPAVAAEAAAPAPAAADKPPARPPLMSADALHALVKRHMGEIPFRLIEHSGLALAELSDQNMMAVYSGTGRPLAAVAVLDAGAVCIIGGGAASMMPALVRPAIATGQPSPRMVELASRFLGEAGPLMQATGPQGLVLRKSNLVSRSLPMLAEVLNRSQWRVDTRISVPGYGEGRLSFLAI